ncbi:MAG: glycosyltransferase family 39 protein [Kiritimatiellae bacterium]|nr:glycosyltransferase family 39 protein [Kiritimatiellia bacterium]
MATPPKPPAPSTIQDLIYNVDVGLGVKLTKIGLYIILVLSLMAVYTATQFNGLRDPEAMDYAQIGRNLMETGQFTTQVIRPATIRFLSESRADQDPMMATHPDVIYPPLYTMILGGTFRFLGASYSSTQMYKAIPPEQWVMIPLNHLFTILTGLILFLLARRYFDPRIAIIGVSLFFLSDLVWQTSITGLNLSLLTLLVLSSIWFGLMASEGFDDPQTKPSRAYLLLGISALFLGLACITRYAAWALVPGFLLWIGLEHRNHRPAATLSLFAGVVILIALPWAVRNVLVCGHLFGMAPQLALNSADPSFTHSFERTLSPDLTPTVVIRNLRTKWVEGMATLYQSNLFLIGNGVISCLFFTTYFFRFVRKFIGNLRWGILLSLFLLLNVAAIYRGTTEMMFVIFWPLILLYGLSFYFIFIDRLQITIPIYRWAMHAVLIITTALPLLFTLMPPRADSPYPPYNPALIAHMSQLLDEDEVLCTDIPWATAWYGDRRSVLLPANIKDFFDINDFRHRISGLYFTTETRDLPYVRTLMSGPYMTWFPLFGGRIPMDFPLQDATLLHQQDQLFLTDRPRWRDTRTPR